MFKIKNTKSHVTAAKRTITVSGVRIVNGSLVDEEGSIIEKLQNEIGNDEITLKVVMQLPDDAE